MSRGGFQNWVDYKWYGPRVEAAAREAAFDALNEEGERLLAAAENTVPLDTGELRRSGDVKDERSQGFIEVGYYAPHAAVQEYGIAWQTGMPYQNYTTPGTGPEFLKGALERRTIPMFRAIGDAVRSMLRRAP